MRPSRLVAALITLACLAGGGVALAHLRVSTEITEFLPPAQDARMGALLRSVASSDLNRTISLSVEAPDEETAGQAAGELAERLSGVPGVAWVRAGPDAQLNQAFYAVYFPRRFALASEDWASLDDDALRARARHLKRELSGLAGPLLRSLAPDDPLLLFPARLDALAEQQRGALRISGGHFLSADGRHGVVLLATTASPFDTAQARSVERAIDDAFAAVNDAHGGILRLEQASVHRLALVSEASVRADVNRVGLVGSLGVCLLLLLLFRSPRWLLLGNLPIAVGVAGAFVASELFFGRLHGLTLAFGATLVGVSIDYVAHYFSHQALAPRAGGPWETLARLRPGLVLGALTTIAGLAGLAWTGFTGIRQMAVFSSFGVAAALLATLFLVAPWLPSEPVEPSALLVGLGRWAARRTHGVGRRVLYVIGALLLVVSAFGFTRLHFADSLAGLSSVNASMQAEDTRVRERVSRMDAGRFVVAFGADTQQALERTERALPLLAQAREQGELQRFQSVSMLLPSLASQRTELTALATRHDLGPSVLRALAEQGFRPELFAPFEASLASPHELLRPEDLRGTPLESLVSPFILPLDEGVAVLTFVRGVQDPAALDARLSSVQGVRLFDQGELLAGAYRLLRERTLEMLLAGLVVVLLLLLVRYRQLRPALAALLPALLAGFVAVGLLSLAGASLTLLHVVALLLVLSMGVDYGVFVVESERQVGADGDLQATLAGLLVACVSTLLSFGMLALSAQPALRAIGLTVALGVGASLLFAPMARLLLGGRS
ncbi:MAG: MMPL family transporter [Deltaproteobacteria bacterium]|nr:MMPL family transporter [Deltaproteobacteria bacterium]